MAQYVTFVTLCNFLIFSLCCGNFVEITSNVFKNSQNSLFVAFGDDNADKLTDIYLMNMENEVSVQLAGQQSSIHKLIASDNSTSGQIVSVVPSDFDGDTRLDLLVCKRLAKTDNFNKFTNFFTYYSQGNSSVPSTNYSATLLVQIYWSIGNNNLSKPVNITSDIINEPLIFDYNADMLPDLLVEASPGIREVWLNGGHRNFSRIHFPNSIASNFSAYGSHSFVDMDKDMNADIVFSVTDGYEIWLSEEGWHFNSTVEFSFTYSLVGQASFIDIDLDGFIDIIVPVCEDAQCLVSKLYVYSSGQWRCLLQSLSVNSGDIWHFVVDGMLREEFGINLPFMINFGDYDIDGYPDGLVTLTNEDQTVHSVFLLHNVPCQDKSSACPSRTFKLTEDPKLSSYSHVLLATFFDIYDDGTLDILLVQRVDSFDNTSLVALQNKYDPNVCFLKVAVGSGLCNSTCASVRHPYGVNLPGRVTCYSITRTDGLLQASCAGIQVQTAHFALQLPYVIFGLGETPSFVDTISVGIPVADHGPNSNTWPQLIPNSQLMVIPHPPKIPSGWTLKLSVTPSRLISVVGVALLIVCGIFALIVGALHLYEYKEDQKEKREEAHKFHFDAM